MTTRFTEIDLVRQRLLEDGYVVIPGVIDPAALTSLRERVVLFYRGWERYRAPTRKEILPPRASQQEYLPVREINWPATMLRLLAAEPAVIAVRRIVDLLVGEEVRLIHANSLLKPAVAGAPVMPHQDTAYNHQPLDNPLTAWIPFEDVSEASGALFYLPGSHRHGDLEHESLGDMHWLDEARLGEKGASRWRSYNGEPGSIGIHDSRIVHGSYPNRTDRDRLALSVRFAASVRR